jgi:tetrahydromethanopterin S-methyltransferase subunit A
MKSMFAKMAMINMSLVNRYKNDMAMLNLINAFNYHSIAYKMKCCCNKDEIFNDDVSNLGLVS